MGRRDPMVRHHSDLGVRMTLIDAIAVVMLVAMIGLYFGILFRIGFIIIEHDG